jgi:hypothetical protein
MLPGCRGAIEMMTEHHISTMVCRTTARGFLRTRARAPRPLWAHGPTSSLGVGTPGAPGALHPQRPGRIVADIAPSFATIAGSPRASWTESDRLGSTAPDGRWCPNARALGPECPSQTAGGLCRQLPSLTPSSSRTLLGPSNTPDQRRGVSAILPALPKQLPPKPRPVRCIWLLGGAPGEDA